MGRHIESNSLSDGIVQIEEGNITNIQNMEVEDNLFVCQDLHVEGEIKGFSIKDNCQVLNIGGEIITTIKLDLSKFVSPSHYGGVISPRDTYKGILLTDENINGIIYEMEVTCLTELNRSI